MSLLAAAQLPNDASGQDIYRLDVWSTAVFVVSAAVATIFPDVLGIAFAVLSCGFFAIGTAAFLWAYAKALERSREEDVSVAMIYGMSGSTPKSIKLRFHLLTVVQTVAAVVAASIHPFTAQAFGILTPMLGLGLAGLWATRHGVFFERTDGRHKARQQAREAHRHG